MDSLADRVRDERLRRVWSVRKAATAGGISNTWWAHFEDRRQPLTDLIAAAVAQAFEWKADWASQPGELDQLRDEVAELRRQVILLLEWAEIDASGETDEPQAPTGDEQ